MDIRPDTVMAVLAEHGVFDLATEGPIIANDALTDMICQRVEARPELPFTADEVRRALSARQQVPPALDEMFRREMGGGGTDN